MMAVDLDVQASRFVLHSIFFNKIFPFSTQSYLFHFYLLYLENLVQCLKLERQTELGTSTASAFINLKKLHAMIENCARYSHRLI